MIGFYNFTKIVCIIGVLVSVGIMFISLPMGIFFMVINLMCVSSIDKSVEKLTNKRK